MASGRTPASQPGLVGVPDIEVLSQAVSGLGARHRSPLTVFKGARQMFVQVHQSPFRIQNGQPIIDSVRRDMPESAGLAVKLPVTRGALGAFRRIN